MGVYRLFLYEFLHITLAERLQVGGNPNGTIHRTPLYHLKTGFFIIYRASTKVDGLGFLGMFSLRMVIPSRNVNPGRNNLDASSIFLYPLKLESNPCQVLAFQPYTSYADFKARVYNGARVYRGGLGRLLVLAVVFAVRRTADSNAACSFAGLPTHGVC